MIQEETTQPDVLVETITAEEAGVHTSPEEADAETFERKFNEQPKTSTSRSKQQRQSKDETNDKQTLKSTTSVPNIDPARQYTAPASTTPRQHSVSAKGTAYVGDHAYKHTDATKWTSQQSATQILLHHDSGLDTKCETNKQERTT